MNIIVYAIAGFLTLGALLTVGNVGKPRKPTNSRHRCGRRRDRCRHRRSAGPRCGETVMTATRTQVAARLHEIAKAIEAGKLPPPSPHWALVFRTDDAAGLAAAARSLGIEDGDLRRNQQEGGDWLQLRSVAGGVPVEVTASAEPVLLDTITDACVIRRTYQAVAR